MDAHFPLGPVDPSKLPQGEDLPTGLQQSFLDVVVQSAMDMEPCRSLLAAVVNDPVPAGDTLGLPAHWGLE